MTFLLRPGMAAQLQEYGLRVTDYQGRSRQLAAAALTLASDPADLSGLRPGDPVVVQADDYGRDPIEGVLAALTPTRITLARECGELDVIHVHFPRVGYVLARR